MGNKVSLFSTPTRHNLKSPMDSKRTHLKLGLKHHKITVENKLLSEPLFDSTSLEAFTARKLLYTVSMGGNYETRETTCGKFSSEITAFISKGAKLIGIDGVNGYKCGPSDDEILQFAHSLDGEDLDGARTVLPPGWFDSLNF